jgi:hypothetical protein
MLLAFGTIPLATLQAQEDYSHIGLPGPDEQQHSGESFSLKNFDFDQLPRFHRSNLPVKPEEVLLTRSCEELDDAITYLLPSSYSYKPGFYDDNYTGAAVWGSTVGKFTIFESSWLYLPYSWLIGYLEEGKQHKAFYHVEQMRRAKAIKNCYVN